MGDLYRDFVEVAKLRSVLARSLHVHLLSLLLPHLRMQELEAAGDSGFLELLNFFKGPKFEAITSWMWSDPGYVEVRLVVTPRLQYPCPQLYKWLRTSGVDMDAIFGWISDQLGMDFTPPTRQM